MSRIVGIDLGTTNCCVAVIDGFKPHVIPNKHGYNTTPSVLAVTEDGSRVVGQIAVRQAITNPENTVYGAKRLMGRIWGSEEVEHARQHSSFDIREGPRGDLRILLAGREHSVPELSAMFLQEMRVVAEDFLGEAVDRAVVTVPAYFNDNQRQAVRDAGRIAGLDVVRILNEPTAAALAYGFGKTEPKTLAVYDLGGGTFDISIVRIDEAGEFHVVSTTGDSFLGGEDFDERLMDFLMAAFERDHGVNLRDAAISLQRVRQAAQKAKADLSSLDRVDLNLPFIVSSGPDGPLHLEYEVTREQLEQLTADLVTRTLQICEVGLQYAQMAPSDVDEVVLVGGMTRMPAIQRAVAGYFEREPCKGVHPDEVVALGAAIAADAIAEDRQDVQLHDVTAHSLGIMTAGGGFDPLIAANTAVPTTQKEVFGTSRDGQNTVKIVVLQGESASALENEVLGRFALTGLREARAGEVEVEVTFRIDEDGIFSVGAKDLETGEEKVIDVLASSGLSDEEIADMMEDSAEYLAHRRAQEAAEKNRQQCLIAIRRIQDRLPEAEKRMAWTPVGANAVKKARQAVQRVEESLSEADPQQVEKHLSLLVRVETMIEKVMSKVE
ncbi:MAG: molecular chaperone DnaK [Sandaracinaceae bacterium]